jgi:putative transposase
VSTFIMGSGDGSGAMRIVNLSKGLRRPKPSASLSREATGRLKWFDWHRAHGENVTRTCRHFDISRSTFYRWKGRYSPWDLRTLEARSKRPRRVRRPSWTIEEVAAVQQARLENPRVGKAKLSVMLLRDHGVRISESRVGRILTHLHKQNQLGEAPRPFYARRRRHNRPYAERMKGKPLVRAPGQLVQLDTLDVSAGANKHFKHFSLVDVFSRYGLMEIRGRATALTARESLERMLDRAPFAVRAIQVDGGSEFMAEFEEFCQRRRIRLFVLPPRSPKLNGRVERAQRTHAEEFYQCCYAAPTLVDLGQELAKWEVRYNRVRPHQALGYVTPAQCLALHQAGRFKPHRGRRPDWQLLWPLPPPGPCAGPCNSPPTAVAAASVTASELVVIPRQIIVGRA